MKKQGSICDFTSQRDAELCLAFRRLIHEASFINLPTIFRKVAESPASRFFVSEQRAYLVISQWRRTGHLPVSTPLRRRMFALISERVDEILGRNPDYSLQDAVFDAVNSPAPSFFLTPGSARTLIYKALNLR